MQSLSFTSSANAASEQRNKMWILLWSCKISHNTYARYHLWCQQLFTIACILHVSAHQWRCNQLNRILPSSTVQCRLLGIVHSPWSCAAGGLAGWCTQTPQTKNDKWSQVTNGEKTPCLNCSFTPLNTQAWGQYYQLPGLRRTEFVTQRGSMYWNQEGKEPRFQSRLHCFGHIIIHYSNYPVKVGNSEEGDHSNVLMRICH